MSKIHPTAIIDSRAKIEDGVTVGPYCVVGKDVNIGKGTVLHSHVCLEGNTSIGNDNEFFPFAAIGFIPQDLKYHGEKSRLIIGNRNTIREYVTMQPGTDGGNMATVIGDDCLFMAGAHMAHDCQIGNSVVMANQATLGGHVTVDDYVTLGGLVAVHQFVKIGRYAMIGGMSGIDKNVLPYASVVGERAKIAGINLVGLKRHGFERRVIFKIREAYEKLFAQSSTLDERKTFLRQKFKDCQEVLHIMDFLDSESSRSICLPRKSGSLLGTKKPADG
ncbi:MAG: acyl-ACP--UDP-N-acetylglucosamine O-acyltransferase [Holosporales bacterium]|jgi:UDP-N-acetylglucosamine acyltransferase|nr:acyl-ACP--UDP-N-acetylglucosamine O-acyltransferase [Holosporales bacterium]